MLKEMFKIILVNKIYEQILMKIALYNKHQYLGY